MEELSYLIYQNSVELTQELSGTPKRGIQFHPTMTTNEYVVKNSYLVLTLTLFRPEGAFEACLNFEVV